MSNNKLDAFTRDYGWGKLKDHMQKCDECNGSGTIKYEDVSHGEEECYCCNGSGELFWGSFYVQDVSYCEHCKKDNVSVAAMYSDGAEYVCLSCYISHHQKQCGCNLWQKAEACVAFK